MLVQEVTSVGSCNGSLYSGIIHCRVRASPDANDRLVLNTRRWRGAPGLLPVRIPCPIRLPWASSTWQGSANAYSPWRRSWIARIEYRVTGWDLPLTITGGRRTAQTRSLIGSQVASETST